MDAVVNGVVGLLGGLLMLLLSGRFSHWIVLENQRLGIQLRQGLVRLLVLLVGLGFVVFGTWQLLT